MNSNPAAAMNARSSAAALKSPGVAAEKPSRGASSFPPTSPPVAPMPTEASMPRPSLNFKYAKLAQPMTAPARIQSIMFIADLSRRGSTSILYRRDSPRLYAGEHCAKDLLGHRGRVRLVDQEARIVR